MYVVGPINNNRLSMSVQKHFNISMLSTYKVVELRDIIIALEPAMKLDIWRTWKSIKYSLGSVGYPN